MSDATKALGYLKTLIKNKCPQNSRLPYVSICLQDSLYFFSQSKAFLGMKSST